MTLGADPRSLMQTFLFLRTWSRRRGPSTDVEYGCMAALDGVPMMTLGADHVSISPNVVAAFSGFAATTRPN